MTDIIKRIQKTKDLIKDVSELSIKELEETIVYAADKYYNTDTPVLLDVQYDALIDFLRLKSPKSKVLKNIGASVKGKNKVKLDYWLGSMDKMKPNNVNDLASWIKTYKGPYHLSDKLDGISALLVYNDNEISMYTRGTANEGLDITPLVKYMNLPKYEIIEEYCKKNKIKGDKNLIAFRGELVIKDKVFNKNWAGKLKNARNSVSGLVNSKKINPELANDTDLVLYEVIDPFFPIDKQMDIIKDLKFNQVEYKFVKELSFDSLSKYLKERREDGDYNIDGIIVTTSGNYKRNIKGNPEYAFAFKDVLEDQIGRTFVKDIEWNVSKDGYINPTLILNPITIGGVEIKRATGFNAKFIVDNVLGEGAEIEIIRSGDVIPYVKKVLKPATSGKPDLPKSDWKWNETKVDIILTNLKDDPNVLIKNIYFFFSTLDTKGLGEKNVAKLIDSGLNSIQKILNAEKKDFLNVEGFGEKTAKNIKESIIKSLTNISLSKLMAASNKLGHGLGEERMKQVLMKYPNILNEYKKWTKQEFINKIKEINGWEEKTSTLFVSNFEDFIKFYDSIKKFVKIEDKKIEKKEGEFSGKTIVFSGFRDNDLQSKLEIQGAKIGSGISKNTDYLIVKDQETLDNPTGKVQKAFELKIKILTKNDLAKLL